MRTKSKRVILRRESGMTVLETLIAVLVLGLTTSAIVSCIVTGDRIAGRRSGLSLATLLAKNEVEKLHSFETALILPNDTSFSSNVNGIEFDVSRTRIKVRRDTVVTDSTVYYGEYAISVKRKNVPAQAVSIRLLQGYYGENK
jgi:Tfp pilus assembly protein PilV